MTDHLTPAQRSSAMSRVRGKDTTPELKVRRLLHSLGYRFRLHRKDLPGKPDIVLPKYKKVIFVHGCFWHLHRCKELPKSNIDYWKEKLDENKRRDRRNRNRLKKIGWDVLVVWECWTKDKDKLTKKLLSFLLK